MLTLSELILGSQARFARSLPADDAVARRVAALCDRKEAEISQAGSRAQRAARAAIVP